MESKEFKIPMPWGFVAGKTNIYRPINAIIKNTLFVIILCICCSKNVENYFHFLDVLCEFNVN